MLSRLTKGQVAAFVILTLVALTYASVVYVRLPQQLGFARYELGVELPETADLYESAAVTLRGEEIGEVHDLALSDTGVRATLWIDDGKTVPADSTAQIRSVSALGEQYLNFLPRSESGPPLREGDVVPAARVELPVPETALLDKATALVRSLPAKSLNTTVDELGTGFGNTGDDLRRLIDGGSALVGTADANFGPTRALIDDLGPFLDTQARLSPQIRSLTADLAGVAGRLRASDDDLRGTLDEVPGFVEHLDDLVSDLRPILPDLLRDLNDVGEVARVYLPSVRQVLLTLPTTNSDLQSVIYGSAVPYSANLNFKAVLNNPPPCQQGFINAGRNINDVSPKAPAYDAFCKEPKTSSIGVRAGRNAPCPSGKWSSSDRWRQDWHDGDVPEFGPTEPAAKADHPRSNDAYGCGLSFQDRKDFLKSRDDATKFMLDTARDFPTNAPQPEGAPPFRPAGVPQPAASQAAAKRPAPSALPTAPLPTATYDRRTGVFLAPDGQPYILGDRSGRAAKGPVSTDWRSLLLEPMGRPAR
jgi:phospholipid/cholesterol/gamma-HCH transport system substrate-binding protein